MQYPSSIPEAALFLDANHRGWAAKINLRALNQKQIKSCVLGQLYGNYFDAMNKLFDQTGERNEDTIFGRHASESQWIEEINKRRSEVKPHNWAWALEQMKAGNRVTKKDWNDSMAVKDNGVYWEKGNILFCTLDLFEYTDYEVVDTRVRVDSLARGSKFKFNGVVHTRCQDDSPWVFAYATETVTRFSPDTLVEPQ